MKTNGAKLFSERKVQVVSVFLIWIAISLLNSSITVLFYLETEQPLKIAESIFWDLLKYSPWLVFIPLTFVFARKVSLYPKLSVRNILFHLLFALILFWFCSIVHIHFLSLQEGFTVVWGNYYRNFLGLLDSRLVLYSVLLLGIYSIDFYRETKEAELKEARLEEDLAKIRFNAFKHNIQPNFLVDNLKSIRKKMQKSPREAEKMMSRLSHLIRFLLEQFEEGTASIKKEVDFLEKFIELFNYSSEFPVKLVANLDEETAEADVPPFFLIFSLSKLFRRSLAGNTNSIEVTYSTQSEDDNITVNIYVKGLNLTDKAYLNWVQENDINGWIENVENRLKNGGKVQLIYEGGNIEYVLVLPSGEPVLT